MTSHIFKPSTIAIVLLVGTFFLAPDTASAAGRVFYDDSEASNTNLWSQDGTRNRCTSVTTTADGIVGPYAGSRMVRCNSDGSVSWDDPAAYETLYLSTDSLHSNEILIRIRVRPDTNHAKTTGSAKKLFRWGSNDGNNDQFAVMLSGDNYKNEPSALWGVQGANYWWVSPDASSDPSSWHTWEIYINQSTKKFRVWHDNQMVQDLTGGSASSRWQNFYITSNWSDAHDAVNYVYFDDVEIFSDTGSGGTGLMSDGTITQGVGDTTAPTAPGTPSCSSSSSTAISCTWTVSTDAVGVTGYRVERCTGHGCSSYTQVGTPSSNSFSDTVPDPTAYQYRVRATDAAGNLSGYSAETAVAAPKDEAFDYGLSDPLFRLYNSSDRALQLADYSELGTKWVRIDITHSSVESVQGTYDWSTYDTVIPALLNAGFKVLGILTYSPAWNRDASCSTSNAAPVDRQAFADFAGAAADRFTGVTWWEIWNEPNAINFWCPAVSAVDFTDVLKKSYVAIKAVQPNDGVVLGGPARAANVGTTTRSPLDFLTTVYANGGKHYFDAVGIHPYGYPHPPSEFYNPAPPAAASAWSQMEETSPSMRSIMTDNGDGHKRLWATEWGAPTNGAAGQNAVTEQQQADDYVTSAFNILGGKTWAGPAFFFAPRDKCTDTQNRECWFGLVYNNWSHKPSFAAYQALTGNDTTAPAAPTGLAVQ